MAYLKGAYQEHSSLPSPTTTTINSSRHINFATRRYTVDSNGNFESMDDTAQRVLLALCFAAPSAPRFLTDRDMEKRRQQIYAALVDLEKEGAIKIKRVVIRRESPGRGVEVVEYYNRNTGANESVTRP